MLWLGIDGGGTKTACSLYNDRLERLDRLVLSTCHYAQAGLNGMYEVLAQGIAWAEQRATALVGGACTTDVGALGIGFAMCGYGEGAATTASIDRLVHDAAGAHPYVLVNDVEAAWAAGTHLYRRHRHHCGHRIHRPGRTRQGAHAVRRLGLRAGR